MDSASTQSAGPSTPAVENWHPDAVRCFAELSGLPMEEVWQEARGAAVDLRSDELASALLAIGSRYNCGLPPNLSPGREQIANFLRGLQLQDVALAQACALGRDAAWHQFMERFRAPLTRAAIAITGSAAAGEELADSLWSEMFGLRERAGQRVSPLAGYSGRGSLLGFLRATLAQRNVDRHRRTHRETELPARELPAMPHTALPDEKHILSLRTALNETLAALNAEEGFLLSSWFLDQRTLLQISRILGVHEATVSRRMQRLTSRLRQELLSRLQANGMTGAAAEEALAIDPRDIDINLRGLLQASRREAFSEKGMPEGGEGT